MKNINWLAVAAVIMMIVAVVCAVLAGSYRVAGIVAALLAIGVAILVVADSLGRPE